MDRAFTDAAYAAETLKLLQQVDADALPREDAIEVDRLRTFTLFALGRGEDASRYAADLRRSRPAYIGGYTSGFIVELEREDEVAALGVLEAAATHLQGSDRREIADLVSTENATGLHRKLTAGEDETGTGRLADALVRLAWTGEGDPAIVDIYRVNAIEHRLATNDVASAKLLAGEVDTPGALLRLLIARRFDPLDIDAGNAATRMRQAVELEGARTQRDFEASPDDWDVLRRRASHLSEVGKSSEAAALLISAASDQRAVEAAGADGLWMVNSAAYALLGTGRGEEAVALLDRLLRSDMRKHSDSINMAINKGSILLSAGHPAEALAHSRALIAQQPGPASPYGEMFMVSTAACAAWELGRRDEAASYKARLLADPHVNEAATLLVYLCTDDMDGAERFLVARLRSEKPDAALTWVQDYQIHDERSDRSRQRAERVAELSRRPAVREAAERVGRVLSLPLSRSVWGF